MNKILLLAVLFLTCFSAFAQRDFRSGYILQKTDTIRGFIDQRGDKRSAAKVNFKKTANSSVETFTPLDIQGYGIWDGAKFEVQTIGKGDSIQTRFLMLLVKGKASLFSYRDTETKDHFYLMSGDSLQELIYYRAKEWRDGKQVYVPYNLFRGNLFKAFEDCPTEMAHLTKLPFTQKALIEAMGRYNKCSSPEQLTYLEIPKKAALTWGVTVGGAHSTLRIDGGASPSQKNQKFTSSFSPTTGLSLHTSLPWVNQKISLLSELQYSRYRYSGHSSEKINTFRKDYEVHLELHYLKLPLQFRYTLPYRKIRPFVNAGLVNSFAINHTQEVTTTYSSTYEENTTVRKEPYINDFRKYAQAYTFGGGVLIPGWSTHLVSLEARYEVGNGFTEYVNISTRTNQLLLLLGFNF